MLSSSLNRYGYMIYAYKERYVGLLEEFTFKRGCKITGTNIQKKVASDTIPYQ